MNFMRLHWFDLGLVLAMMIGTLALSVRTTLYKTLHQNEMIYHFVYGYMKWKASA